MSTSKFERLKVFLALRGTVSLSYIWNPQVSTFVFRKKAAWHSPMHLKNCCHTLISKDIDSFLTVISGLTAWLQIPSSVALTSRFKQDTAELMMVEIKACQPFDEEGPSIEYESHGSSARTELGSTNLHAKVEK